MKQHKESKEQNATKIAVSSPRICYNAYVNCAGCNTKETGIGCFNERLDR